MDGFRWLLVSRNHPTLFFLGWSNNISVISDGFWKVSEASCRWARSWLRQVIRSFAGSWGAYIHGFQKKKQATFSWIFVLDPNLIGTPRGHPCPNLIPWVTNKSHQVWVGRTYLKPWRDLHRVDSEDLAKVDALQAEREQLRPGSRGHIDSPKKKPRGIFLEENLWLGMFGIHREILHTTPT